MSDKKKIADLVEQELSSFLPENGLELYHVDFKKQGKDWYLDVYIDIADGDRYVDTSDCEKVSEYLGKRLDELDPIEQNYILEVSSPGLDRELYEQKDFDRFKGELVDVKLYKQQDGRKEFQGELLGLEDDTIKIKEDDEIREFVRKDVAKTCLAVVF